MRFRDAVLATFSVFGAFFAAAVLAQAPDAGAELLGKPIPTELIAGARSLVARPLFSPDGELFAVTVRNGRKSRPLPFGDRESYGPTGVPDTWSATEIWIKDLNSGAFSQLNDTASSNWAPSWSADGRQLAFFSDQDGAAQVWVWDRETGKTRRVSESIVRATQSNSRPLWVTQHQLAAPLLGAGRTIAEARADAEWKPRPKTGDADAPTLTLASEHKDSTIKVDLSLIDLYDGSVRRLVVGADAWNNSLSPDGAFAAYDVWSASGVSEIYVVSLKDGSRKLTLEKRSFSPTYVWSVDSAYLLVNDRRGALLIDTRTWQSTPLPSTERTSSVAWAPDRNDLLLSQGEVLVRLSVKEGKASETARIRVPASISSLVTDANGFAAQVGTRGSTAVVGIRDGDYLAVDLRRRSHRVLYEHEEARRSSDLTLRPRSASFLVALGDETRHADLWLMHSGRRPERLTTLNPELERYAKGRSTLVEWTDAQGRKLEGALLLPADYRKGQRYPMLVDVYGDRDPKNHLREVGLGGESAQWNYQALASRGYAVFYPAAPIGENTVMKDLADAVFSGIDKVVDMGVADPARLAVAGQSFGGYCVRALLVQTDRFKAAISTAGVSGNLLHDYPFALGQHRITVDPFSGLDVFLRNSPFLRYDKINAALLIQIGMNDGIGNNPETYRDYFVLRSLGVDAEILEYHGEGHVLMAYNNLVDFWNRRIAWLDKYLNADAGASRSQ